MGQGPLAFTSPEASVRPSEFLARNVFGGSILDYDSQPLSEALVDRSNGFRLVPNLIPLQRACMLCVITSDQRITTSLGANGSRGNQEVNGVMRFSGNLKACMLSSVNMDRQFPPYGPNDLLMMPMKYGGARHLDTAILLVYSARACGQLVNIDTSPSPAFAIRQDRKAVLEEGSSQGNTSLVMLLPIPEGSVNADIKVGLQRMVEDDHFYLDSQSMRIEAFPAAI